MQGQCSLRVADNNPPLLTQKFGSKTIVIPFKQKLLTLDNGEQLQAYCPTGFG